MSNEILQPDCRVLWVKMLKSCVFWSRRRPTAAAAAALRPWSHWEKKQNMSPLQVQHWSWVDDVQCPSESTKGSLLLTQTLFNRTTALSLVQTSGEVGPWIECLKKRLFYIISVGDLFVSWNIIPEFDKYKQSLFVLFVLMETWGRILKKNTENEPMEIRRFLGYGSTAAPFTELLQRELSLCF